MINLYLVIKSKNAKCIINKYKVIKCKKVTCVINLNFKCKNVKTHDQFKLLNAKKRKKRDKFILIHLLQKKLYV